MSYQIHPQEAGSEVLKIINQVYDDNRPLSEFEQKKIEKCLTSLRRVSEHNYNTVAVCYFAGIADIDNMLSCARAVLEKGTNEDIPNVVIALANTMRYKDLYNYTIEYNILSKVIEQYANLIHKIFVATLLFYEGELSKSLLIQQQGYTQKEDNFFDFFKKNNADRKDIQLYIAECFDIFSRKILPKLYKIISFYRKAFNIYSDEICEFLHVSLIFKINKEDFNTLIEIEDEYLSLISEIDCKPSIEMKVSFSFELEEGVM